MDPKSKQILMVVAFFAIAAALYFGYKGFSKQYTVDPKKIFTDNFNEDVDMVQDLKGGGNISGNYDVWIHFKLDHRAKIKGTKEFDESPADLVVAQEWFAKNTPYAEDPSLSIQQRRFLKVYNHLTSTDTQLEHDWLLHNWRTNDHYFRAWGY